MTNSPFLQYHLEGDRRLSRPSQKIQTSTDDGRRLVQYHFSYFVGERVVCLRCLIKCRETAARGGVPAGVPAGVRVRGFAE